jgi:hypothetical protein
MIEEWRPVRDFPEYQVSTLGRIKREDRLLTQRVVKNYSVVNLCKDGVKSTRKVHRLIGDAFLPNPDQKPTIDHINRENLDNRLENLRWATHKEQANNRGSFPLQGTNTGEPYITFNKNYIVAIRKKGRKSFPTLEEAIAFRDSIL